VGNTQRRCLWAIRSSSEEMPLGNTHKATDREASNEKCKQASNERCKQEAIDTEPAPLSLHQH